MEYFGEGLKKMRESKRISQSELAKRLDIQQPNISRWELGKVNPRSININKICEALRCTEKELANMIPVEDSKE